VSAKVPSQAPFSSTVMRLASVIVLALISVGCGSFRASGSDITQICAVPYGWHRLARAPANSQELLSLARSANPVGTGRTFGSEVRTHAHWFSGGNELAYCRYQKIRGSCDWPNSSVRFRQVSGIWVAEPMLPTVCIRSAP
jgi:hypothetical protein